MYGRCTIFGHFCHAGGRDRRYAVERKAEGGGSEYCMQMVELKGIETPSVGMISYDLDGHEDLECFASMGRRASRKKRDRCV